MNINYNWVGRILLLPLWILSAPLWAGDISSDVRSTEPTTLNKRGGFLEIGIAAAIEERIQRSLNPDQDGDLSLAVRLSLSAGYRYDRLFFEASESGFDGLNMGVVLWENDRWRFDALLANVAGNLTVESDEPPPPTTEAERNRAIIERDSFYVAAGGRLSGYFGNTLIQFRLVSDWYDDNGLLGSARVGRNWQLGNWNIQAVAGMRYNSSQFNNYLYGITSEEASERFPEFTTKHAWISEVELGASLPLKENWVYSSRLRFRHYPGSVTDSPLVIDGGDVILTTAIHYVF
ncbi:MAG: MipA/OmpV family protein [Granulosicoccus sp.]